MRHMIPDPDGVLAADPDGLPAGEKLGSSREGRPVIGFRFGRGSLRVSLIAGCHADEPVGPRLLRHLVAFLAGLPRASETLARIEWWIVPHANPDGEAVNLAWAGSPADAYDPVDYVRGVRRELPGDDVEFGFPRDAVDTGARPENRALLRWWSSAPRPFALHASLHGMAVAAGPWFLIEPAWAARTAELQEACRRETAALGYRLHDVDRRGEKGFVRIGPGFTTRPDSREMIRHFRERGDEATAALFRPSSMETVRSLGGDPLTLVSEMPLFLLPPPPDGVPSTSADVTRWKERLGAWQRELEGGRSPDDLRREIADAGIVPMPVTDQMRLQWTFISAGLRAVRP